MRTSDARAGERLQSLQQRASQGLELPHAYAYGSRPLREQILEEIPGHRSPIFAPASSESELVMRAAGADPAFIQLCRIQDSFRARLTPKPFRVGQKNPPGRFPRDDPNEQAAFAEWLQQYERATANSATCRFVETIGTGWVHREISSIVRLHDERTRADSDLPLA